MSKKRVFLFDDNEEILELCKEILLDLSLDLPEYINPRASRSPWRIRIWPGIVTENIHALLFEFNKMYNH